MHVVHVSISECKMTIGGDGGQADSTEIRIGSKSFHVRLLLDDGDSVRRLINIAAKLRTLLRPSTAKI